MVIIDGVVGAGKTTLAEKISSKIDIPIYYELQSDVTMNMLEDFYKDKNRRSFALQIHFLNERFKMVKDIAKQGGGILDRSIFGDKIFASMLNEDGYMNDLEFYTYSTLLDNMLEHVEKPKLLVYIDCDLDTAMDRIKVRGRDMEQSVDAQYWGRLNDKYNAWYDTYDQSKKISIDATSYHPDNEVEIQNIVDRIKGELM